MPIWLPRDEMRADLEDQAKKRLEEIARAAQSRRTQVVNQAQTAITNTGVDDVMARFNSLIDPLINQGRQGIDTLWNNSPDTPSAISDTARKLVEQASQPAQIEPPAPPITPPTDGLTPPSPLSLGGAPEAPTPPAPTPPPMPSPLAQTPPSPIPDLSAQPYTPSPTSPMSFKPPGLGGLGDSLGGALDGLGGLGEGIGGLGDKVTQGRDQAMELANKSLDVARDAVNRGGSAFEQTPVARAVMDANRLDGSRFRPPGVDGTAPARDPFQGITDSLSGFRDANARGVGLDAIRDAALPLFTGPSAASKVAEEIAPWTPEMQRNQDAWKSVQGTERPGAGLGGLLEGAGRAAQDYERQTREQGETMLGRGTQGEGPLQAAQAAFGYAMAPWGAAPEVARGAVEEATGSPLAGAAAYGAASILGPGGIRQFLSEGGPIALRMLTNPRVIPELLANDPKGTFKAVALALGAVGGTGAGGVTAVQAIREGKSPQEAAAEAVTTAADWLQISEAAGIPIEGVAKIWGVLPRLGIQPPRLPGMPGMPGMPRPPSLPGMPERPGQLPLPGESPTAPAAPAETPSLPGERPTRPTEPLGPTAGESIDAINNTGVTTRGRSGAPQGPGVPRSSLTPELDALIAAGERPSFAQTAQVGMDADRRVQGQVEEASAAAYDEIEKKTEAQSRRPTPGTPEAPRDYDPNGLGVGIPVASRGEVAGAAPTPRIEPRALISDPQTASTGPATTTPAAAESLRQVADSLAGEGPQAGERAGRPIAGANAGGTDPTGFQRNVATPGKAIYDAIMSGKASTVDGFRKVVREILGRDPITAGKKSEAIDYLKGFPRTESGREVPDFLFNPEHNPAVKETADADGNTTRTLPSGLYVTLNPQGQVVGEQRLRRADDPVSYIQGALQDYGEARDPTSGLLYRDWYLDTSGVLADVAKRVVGGDEKSPGFRNVLNNLVAAVGITTPQTEPTANVKKALYLNILYRDWKKARASAGMEMREPTWQELVDMGRTGQVVVGLKRPVAPGAPIRLADEAPILGGYHTVKEGKTGSMSVSDWEPLIPGISGPGDHRVLAKNPAWVVDEILMSNQVESFVDAMRDGQLSVKNGRKSPTFGLQLFNAWARRFLPWSVEDRHMHEAAGVNYDVESKSSGIYDILQGITRAHGDMYPGRPMDPHQAQAAIWAFEKFENAASKADNDPEMILPDAIRMPDGRVIPAGEHAPRGTMLDMRNRLRQLSDQFAQSYTGPVSGKSKIWNPKTGSFDLDVDLKGEHVGITNEASPYEGKGPFGGVKSQQVGYDVVEAAEGAARREGYAVTAEAELPGIVTDDGGRRYLDWLDEDHEVGADGRTVHTYSTDVRKAEYVAARIGERTNADAVGYVIATPEGGDRSVLLVGKPDGGRWSDGEVRSLSEQVGAQAALTPDGTHVYWADTNTGAPGTGPDMNAVRAGLETHLDGSYTVREARAVTGAVTADQRPAVLSTTFPRDEPPRTGEPVGFGDDGRPGGATRTYPSPYGSRQGAEGVKVPRRLPVPPIVGTRSFGPLGGQYDPGSRGRAASARRAAVEPVPPSGLNAPVRFTDGAGLPYDYTPAALPAPGVGVSGAPELQGAPGKPPRGPVGVAVENARIAHAFREAPPLEQGGRLLDEDGEFSPEAVQRVAQAPETTNAAGYVQATLQHLRNRLVAALPDQAAAYERAHFGGLAVGSKYYGANYDGPRVLGDPEAGNQILTNLHAIHADTAGDVRSGLLTPEQAPEAMARQAVLKLVHELTHQEVWSHDGKTKKKEFTFAQALNRNLDLLAPDIERLTAQLGDQIRQSGLYDALGRQADDLRSAPRSADEVAAGAAELPGQPAGQSGDAALGADAGASGRGEPAGVVGDRPGGAEPGLGTGADLGGSATGAVEPLDTGAVLRSYEQHAPAQAAWHNDPENLGSSFNPVRGNLGDENVFMVGVYPTRTWEIDGTHEVTPEQFRKFAADNADLLTAHPGLSIGTWKDNRLDGTKYVALDLSLAVDNKKQAGIIGHLLRQDAIHQMRGHKDIRMSKKKWGPALVREGDIQDAIERVLGARALEAGGAGARSAAGGLPGEAAGAGATQRAAGEVGAAADTGVAADGSGGEADGAVAPAGEKVLAVAYARRRRPVPSAGEPPPEWGVPEHNRQGHAMGLGNLDTRADMDRIEANVPEGGYTGAQQEEIARFGARLGAREAMEKVTAQGVTPEQRAVRSETEGRRRQTRAAEGGPSVGATVAAEYEANAQAKRHTQAVDEAQGPSATEDALADAEDAGARGEIQPSDVDNARGIAARKLQRAKGSDEPLGPNELDEATAASRQRRGVTKPEPVPPPEQAPEATPATRPARRRAGILTDEDKRLIERVRQQSGTKAAEEFQRARTESRAADRKDKRSAIDKIVDDAERATAERAKAEGSAGKQPVAFPDARPIEPPRPGAEGEPAVVKLDLTQPPAGAEARVPLPGFEGMVTNLQSIAEDLQKASDREAGVTPGKSIVPEVEGSAAQIPVAEGTSEGPLEPGQIRVAERTPEGPQTVTEQEAAQRRVPLPGMTPAVREAQSPEGAALSPQEAADRLLARQAEADAARQAANERNQAANGPAERRAPTEPQLAFPDTAVRDLGDRNLLVGPDGQIMSRARAQANIMGRMVKPGGWAEVRDEMLGLASDPFKMALALGKQIPTSKAEWAQAMAEAEKLFGLKAPDWDAVAAGEKRFRPGHLLDMLGAYSRINLIFNPESWMRNMISTSVGVPYRMTEAVISPFFNRAWQGIGNRDAKSTYVGESLAMLEGLIRSISAASANALGTVRRGNETAKAQMDDPTANFYNTKLGKGMEVFFRPLTAGDVFFKTLNEGMESFRLAYRQASDEAHSGVWGANPLHSKIRSRMWEIASTATPKFLDQVQQAGEYNTFNAKADGFVKRIEALKNWDGVGGPAVRVLANIAVPFVRIPVNVAKWGWERTPVGGLLNTAVGGMKSAMVRDENGKLVRKYTKDSAEMGDRTARLTQGAVLAASLYAAEQAGLIEISGGKPDNEDEAAEWKLQGKTPYSVKWGDRWYDPSNIPGFGQTVLQAGILKDAVGAWQDADEAESEDLFGRIAGTLGKGIESYVGQENIRPMFGSVAHALVALNPAFPEQQRAFSRDQLLNSAVSQFTPLSGMGRALGGVTDQYERDPQTISERVAALNPFTRENLPERVDALGRPLESERYKNWGAGITSSRAASDEGLPRVYRGSTSATMDRQITQAVTAVQGYERDPRSYRRPTAQERMLARRYGSRKNPAREKLNAKVKRADRIRELQRSDEGVFRFQAPGRIRDLIGA